MIFVGMREHKSHKIPPLLLQKADIRHDAINAGQIVARKGDAKIDREPGLLALRTDTIHRQIHADLADPAERREDQFLVRGCHLRSGSKLALFGRVERPQNLSTAEPHTPSAMGFASSTPSYAVRSRGNTSPAAITSSSPFSMRSISRPASSMVSKRPVVSLSASLTWIACASPWARASQAARMSAKPVPRFHWIRRVCMAAARRLISVAAS